MSVTSESRRDKMQVLVDGQWVDVGGTVQSLDGFTVGEPIVDEVQQMPTSFEMSMQIDPASAAGLWETIERIEREQRAERARRRLWLRSPLPPRPMLCGRLPIARMPS
ncbi:hypothetical protein SEA_PHONEGINGI_67 [Microbacterium phage Phonegingi]|nr:hypothetical protein SEA_PHONEGINGI_67 [Microbacterium phage Phonegingi]